MKKNGLSGVKIFKQKNVVTKEANNNFETFKKVIKILKIMNFQYSNKILDVSDNLYTYEYVEGNTLEKVVTMKIEQILKCVDIILKLQSTYIDKYDNVIVHGDVSPVNMVFDKDWLPIKLIDWDGSYFGSKYDDISYICWLWVNFGDDKKENDLYVKNIIIILKYVSYSLEDVKKVKTAILDRIKLDKSKNKHISKELEFWYKYTNNWVHTWWGAIENEF